ncbi:MAG: hypothetical protein COA41_14310 [Sphingopyxis sp.]|nr:MAG: hypothetical protein COA41_14310 [Sphingopyxis sp.]
MVARMVSRMAAALLATVTVAASPGHACSVVPSYKVPTNLELAEAADVIVIAEVTGERAGADEYDNRVVARPTVLLKGATLPPAVELAGAWLEKGAQMQATVSSPQELRAPNPDALIGGCVRYVFAPGMKLVLFLERDDSGALVPFRSAFSRDAEDVAGEDALWVKAVKEYAAISLLPAEQRKAQLRKRIVALQTETDDPDSLAIAADMQVELEGRRRPAYD